MTVSISSQLDAALNVPLEHDTPSKGPLEVAPLPWEHLTFIDKALAKQVKSACVTRLPDSFSTRVHEQLEGNGGGGETTRTEGETKPGT